MGVTFRLQEQRGTPARRYDVVGGLAVPGKPGVFESGFQVGASQGKSHPPADFGFRVRARAKRETFSADGRDDRH